MAAPMPRDPPVTMTVSVHSSSLDPGRLARWRETMWNERSVSMRNAIPIWQGPVIGDRRIGIEAASRGQARRGPRGRSAPTRSAAWRRCSKPRSGCSRQSGVDAPYRDYRGRGGRRHGHDLPPLPAALGPDRRGLPAGAAGLRRRRNGLLRRPAAPGEALDRWMQRLGRLRRGQAGFGGRPALRRSGLRGFAGPPRADAPASPPGLARRSSRPPASIRAGVDAWDLLRAASGLCTPAPDVTPDHPQRMVALLVDGLRYRVTISRG